MHTYKKRQAFWFIVIFGIGLLLSGCGGSSGSFVSYNTAQQEKLARLYVEPIGGYEGNLLYQELVHKAPSLSPKRSDTHLQITLSFTNSAVASFASRPERIQRTARARLRITNPVTGYVHIHDIHRSAAATISDLSYQVINKQRYLTQVLIAGLARDIKRYISLNLDPQFIDAS